MNLERLGACKERVCESGKPGHRQESVWEAGKPGDMQESVCDVGESVKVLSLRALRARAGGDHMVAQLWTSFCISWDQSGTNLRTIRNQFGTNLGTTLGPIWVQSGTYLGRFGQPAF